MSDIPRRKKISAAGKYLLRRTWLAWDVYSIDWLYEDRGGLARTIGFSISSDPGRHNKAFPADWANAAAAVAPTSQVVLPAQDRAQRLTRLMQCDPGRHSLSRFPARV